MFSNKTETNHKQKNYKSHSKLMEIRLEAASRAGATAAEPKNLKKWPCRTVKGGVYLNEQNFGIFSNSYVLDLKKPSTVHFAIQTSTTQLHSSRFLGFFFFCFAWHLNYY